MRLAAAPLQTAAGTPCIILPLPARAVFAPAPPSATSQESSRSMSKPARTLTFKCHKCTKPVTLFLQKASACAHIQPYQGWCKCGELMRHATGEQDAVQTFVSTGEIAHHHHHHHH